MTTATIHHTVGVEDITDSMRRWHKLPYTASLAAVERYSNGFVKVHGTNDNGHDVFALAKTVAEDRRATFVTSNRKPVADVGPKPGVCQDCGAERPIGHAVGHTSNGNQCPCKAKAGAR